MKRRPAAVGAVLAAAAAAGTGAIVSAQITDNGCLRLLGSAACPGFQYAYLSPGNLSNAFPFFDTVTDVASFDSAVFTYFSNRFQFQTTKFIDQLQCTNSTTAAVIQWERTVLCSMWVNEQWSTNCLAFYNGTSAATSQKMVCQQTCLQYSASEYAIVNDTSLCPGTDFDSTTRNAQLVKDFTDCTNWTTLATNDSASCVSGPDNENNCGFGSSIAQLCSYCSGTSPDTCCYQGSVDESVCGYALPAQSGVTSSAATSSLTATPTGTLQNATSSSTDTLSGGQLAGTIVGSVIGGLLVIGLLVLALFLLLRRRKRRARLDGTYESTSSGLGLFTGTTGKEGSAASTTPRGTMSDKVPFISSQPATGAPSMNSPTAGDVTLGSVGGGKPILMGAGAAGVIAPRTAGTLLTRVKDENQNQAGGDKWIETSAEVTVLYPYNATLPDELALRPGMRLVVLRLYDDGWGTGLVIAGESDELGKVGAFPTVCVSGGTLLSLPSSSRLSLSAPPETVPEE